MSIPTSWDWAVSSWLSSLHAKGLSSSTIALYRSHVSQLARGLACSPESVSTESLEEWCAKQKWASVTRRSAYIVYGQFFTHLHERTGAANPTHSLTSPPPPPREPRPAPEEAIAEALRTADPRVALMIHLGATLGLRIGEIVLIHRDDIEQEFTGPVLRVHGKGNKKRSVPISQEFASELLEWCNRVNGWAFPSQRGKHLTPHSASAILSAALPGKWTAHTLRHRFATMAYEVDRDILTVQRLLGHASVATTMRYARPPREALVRAVQGASLGDVPSPAICLDFRGSDVTVTPEGLHFVSTDGTEYTLQFDEAIQSSLFDQVTSDRPEA
ncbi:tyrosine-type recombinase/integrase [Corynebacterium atrinae]|uniref:tyrosine-type recombinase/integrase n=1 Tax=Corynebacterium atrinae TaxID=1336740 RepID=UPI00338D8A7B